MANIPVLHFKSNLKMQNQFFISNLYISSSYQYHFFHSYDPLQILFIIEIQLGLYITISTSQKQTEKLQQKYFLAL